MNDLRDPHAPEDHPFFEAMYAQFADRELPESRRRRWPRRPAAALGGVWRPAPLAGAGVALAAIVAALVLLLGPSGAGGPAPAYGVSFGSGNSITIHWNQFKQIEGLNLRLAQLGMRIRIVPIVHGCRATAHQVIYPQVDTGQHIRVDPTARTIEVPPPTRSTDVTSGTLETFNDTVAGHTRIFTVTRSGGWDHEVFTVAGAVPRCVGDNG